MATASHSYSWVTSVYDLIAARPLRMGDLLVILSIYHEQEIAYVGGYLAGQAVAPVGFALNDCEIGDPVFIGARGHLSIPGGPITIGGDNVK